LLKELLAKLPTIKGIIQDKLSYYVKSCQVAADRFSPPFHLVGNFALDARCFRTVCAVFSGTSNVCEGYLQLFYQNKCTGKHWIYIFLFVTKLLIFSFL